MAEDRRRGGVNRCDRFTSHVRWSAVSAVSSPAETRYDARLDSGAGACRRRWPSTAPILVIGGSSLGAEFGAPRPAAIEPAAVRSSCREGPVAVGCEASPSSSCRARSLQKSSGCSVLPNKTSRGGLPGRMVTQPKRLVHPRRLVVLGTPLAGAGRDRRRVAWLAAELARRCGRWQSAVEAMTPCCEDDRGIRRSPRVPSSAASRTSPGELDRESRRCSRPPVSAPPTSRP